MPTNYLGKILALINKTIIFVNAWAFTHQETPRSLLDQHPHYHCHNKPKEQQNSLGSL